MLCFLKLLCWRYLLWVREISSATKTGWVFLWWGTVCLVPQDWVLRRHFSDLAFFKTRQILTYLNYDVLQVQLSVNWFGFGFLMCLLFGFVFFIFGRAPHPDNGTARAGKYNWGLSCSTVWLFCVLHHKHCMSKERPKGEVPCSKSGNQALDWEPHSVEIQPRVLLLNCRLLVGSLFW